MLFPQEAVRKRKSWWSQSLNHTLFRQWGRGMKGNKQRGKKMPTTNHAAPGLAMEGMAPVASPFSQGWLRYPTIHYPKVTFLGSRKKGILGGKSRKGGRGGSHDYQQYLPWKLPLVGRWLQRKLGIQPAQVPNNPSSQPPGLLSAGWIFP